MSTVTISKEEYEKLKRLGGKIKKIDQTIHDEITTHDVMLLQEKGKSFDFLLEEGEDIYSEKDLKNE